MLCQDARMPACEGVYCGSKVRLLKRVRDKKNRIRQSGIVSSTHVHVLISERSSTKSPSSCIFDVRSLGGNGFRPPLGFGRFVNSPLSRWLLFCSVHGRRHLALLPTCAALSPGAPGASGALPDRGFGLGSRAHVARKRVRAKGRLHLSKVKFCHTEKLY